MNNDVLQYLEQHQEQFFNKLRAWVQMPSISADSAFDADCDRAAAFLATHLEDIGMQNVQRLATKKHDVVYAEYLQAPDKPTLLLYGHYDVQPAGDESEWEHPPFDITCKDDGYMYGRGVQDNKGQAMLICNALEAWLKTAGSLPVNVKCYFEGDEESGDAGVLGVGTYKDKLACDAVVIADTSWVGLDKPTITYGLRGCIFFELFVQGPNRELHSGVQGGLTYNPINVCCEVLGRVRGADGQIQFPGFYDDMRPLAPEEVEAMYTYDIDAEGMMRDLEVDALMPPDEGLPHRAMQNARPTYDLAGIFGGHMGEGPKTIIPSDVTAKFSCRLVPDQDPDKIEAGVREFITEHMPKGVRWKLDRLYGSPATLTPHDHPFLKYGCEALEETFDKPAVLARDGGAIPITIAFQEELKVPLVMCGMGLPGDAIHSPKERFSKTQYEKGAACIARLLAKFAN